MDTTVPLNALHITDHKYHGRDVEARKTDTTSHFNAPLNAAEVQDHKYQQERRGHSKLPVEVPKTPKAPKAPKVARKHHHSKLPVESPKAPKVARKHDQTTHVDSILGTSMDYHPYKDNRYAILHLAVLALHLTRVASDATASFPPASTTRPHIWIPFSAASSTTTRTRTAS